MGLNDKVISWNVRSLDDRRKRVVTRNCLKEWRAILVCFQETKIEVLENGWVEVCVIARSFGGLNAQLWVLPEAF